MCNLICSQEPIRHGIAKRIPVDIWYYIEAIRVGKRKLCLPDKAENLLHNNCIKLYSNKKVVLLYYNLTKGVVL